MKTPASVSLLHSFAALVTDQQLTPLPTIRSEFLLVAIEVLKKEKRSLRPREIVAIALREGMFSDKRAGRTPHQTMKSKLSVHIRRYGTASPFVRTWPGKFFLRDLLQQGQAEYTAPALTKKLPLENVLVFDVSFFSTQTRFQGIKKFWRRYAKHLVDPTICSYIERYKAETILTHKQIVTYVMVSRKRSVLVYRRGNYNNAEAFLKGSLCVGFGGHLSEHDNDMFSDGFMGIFNCAKRELAEELCLPDEDRKRIQDDEGFTCIGMLNDDSSLNGQRHFAFLFLYEVSDDPYWDNPARGEKSITGLFWLDPRRNDIRTWEFEYWSQLCLREFLPRSINTSPSFKVWRRNCFRPPNVVCVIGPIGSGKTETIRILTHGYGFFQINTGRVLAHLLKMPPVPDTPREVFQQAAWSFIGTVNGPQLLAAAIWEEVLASNKGKVLIDGLRQRRTLEALRELSVDRKLGVTYVHTLPDLAYYFYVEREQSGIGIDDFMRIRNAPVEREIEAMLEHSDAALYNWAGIGAYRRAIASFCSCVDIVPEFEGKRTNERL